MKKLLILSFLALCLIANVFDLPGIEDKAFAMSKIRNDH